MVNWIHRLLNPHCEHCKEESEDNRICKSCETLKQQLDIANFEKRQLLQSLLESQKPAPAEVKNQVDYEPLKPRSVPWTVRKQLLEAEDRERARLLGQNKNRVEVKEDKEIEELERQLGIVEG